MPNQFHRANMGVRVSTSLALFLVLGFAVFLLAGCGGETKTAAPVSSGGLEKTFERGPLKVVVRLDNPKPSIADRITLGIEAVSDQGYDVLFPKFGERLEQFGIVDFATTQPELVEGGKERQTMRYVLEPFLSGEYAIPPMTIRFRKEGEPEENAHELVTEELKVVVSSLLPEDAENLVIHEIAPPVALPKPRPVWLWSAVIAGAVAGVLAAIFVVLIKRRKIIEAAVPRPPAHEIAFAELKRLVDEDLPGAGRIKEFYQRISDILRHYIENRFGLRAPERTTEEFLAELRFGAALAKDHQPLLGTFLTHCDLVKFAEHQPGTDDIQNTFDSCKNFIIATQEDAPSRAPAS